MQVHACAQSDVLAKHGEIECNVWGIFYNILSVVKQPNIPTDRRVIWVVGEQGDEGKDFFQNHWITFNFISLHCIALHCIGLHCIVLYSEELHCIGLHLI